MDSHLDNIWEIIEHSRIPGLAIGLGGMGKVEAVYCLGKKIITGEPLCQDHLFPLGNVMLNPMLGAYWMHLHAQGRIDLNKLAGDSPTSTGVPQASTAELTLAEVLLENSFTRNVQNRTPFENLAPYEDLAPLSLDWVLDRSQFKAFLDEYIKGQLPGASLQLEPRQSSQCVPGHWPRFPGVFPSGPKFPEDVGLKIVDATLLDCLESWQTPLRPLSGRTPAALFQISSRYLAEMRSAVENEGFSWSLVEVIRPSLLFWTGIDDFSSIIAHLFPQQLHSSLVRAVTPELTDALFASHIRLNDWASAGLMFYSAGGGRKSTARMRTTHTTPSWQYCGPQETSS